MKTEADEGTLRQKRHLDRLSRITSYMRSIITSLLPWKVSLKPLDFPPIICHVCSVYMQGSATKPIF